MIVAFALLSLASLVAAAAVLVALFVIDWRTYLLPDRLVFPLGVLGAAFHTLTQFAFLEPSAMIMGALVGGGLLWVVRWAGTRYYRQEAMGLGDVKLLLAGGVWLGPQHIITAILIGAAAGLVHGVGVAALHAYRTKTPMTLKRLVIPAGPGFIVGLIAAFVLAFGQGYIQSILVILGR